MYVAQRERTGKLCVEADNYANTGAATRRVNWEIQVHETFNHPNLVKFCGFVTERQNGGADVTLLLSPLCSRGSLESALQRSVQKSGVFFSESETLSESSK